MGAGDEEHRRCLREVRRFRLRRAVPEVLRRRPGGLGVLTVRAATAGDVAATCAVASAAYRAGFAHILPADVLAGRTPESFRARFEAVLGRLMVAEREGAVVGFALMTEGHIDMMFVDPAVHRGGVGRALLAACEARGARSLECFRDNVRARAFYEAHGWRLAREYARDFAGATHHFVFYEK